MDKTLRGASVERLVNALKKLGYLPYKPPHEYKRGKFHCCITVFSATRCRLSLHRDRPRILVGHEAIWRGKDLTEEMNKILTMYFQKPKQTANI